ncbi:DMT family transporter [Polymorphum gilvum]|uniref:Permease, DMT superfamily n=1 Tax=Polymorphum gilvum (strain LMG 25793 / CGMCC 1.9160 / SL003B-26A1) TaxID=991905 RepID=F2J315_POLGS|nr:DMT family transporter [Polymorphum gilvum]ADZ68885.1 Permease, DMT superfamily [Polymorphum gilvum SL003B-26A1]
MTLKGLIAALTPAVFVLLWSTGFIGSKLGAPYAEPFVFLTLRFLLVLPALALIAVLAGAKWPDRPALVGHCIVTGMLVHGVYLGGVFWAIDNGMPAGAASLVVGLQPLVSTLGAGWILNEKILSRHWAGMALGAFGLVLVLAPRLGEAGSGITAATIAAVLLAVVAISLGTVYQKRFVPFTDHVAATTWQYVGALLVTVPLAFTETWTVEWTGEFVFALGWLVVVLSIGAILLLMALIRAGAVAEVASLFYLVPVATTVESYLLFGERLTLVQIGGMVLVVAAILLIRRRQRRPSPA